MNSSPVVKARGRDVAGDGVSPPFLCPTGAGAASAAFLAVAVGRVWIVAVPTPTALAAQEPPADGADGSQPASTADSLVRASLDRARAPGAVVVAVRDGRVLLSKGYGLADLEAGIPMSDATTVLAVGSLAKPLTAAVALRLAARGELDLGEDIRNRTAALDVPIRHDAPITAAHLLTHTAGFDDTDFGDAARRRGEAASLDEHLEHAMPPQSFAPGRFHRYSNHGYALLGWLLQEASGTDFAGLVDRELFRTLGMRSSSFEQVPPADLEARMARGHVPGEEGPDAVPADYSNVPPADGLLTTGRDMSRLLLALTDSSEAGGLPTAVRQRMLATAFTYHDSLPGVTFAFPERPVHDRAGLEHTGGRVGFTSQLVLVPEARFGLFVALNLRDGAARSRLTEDLLDVLLPEMEGRVALSGDAAPAPATDPGRLTGAYRSLRYNRHTMEKLAVLLGLVPTVSVERTAGSGLRIGSGTFFEMAPLLFRWEEARWYNVFLEEDGDITHLVAGHRAFERVAWWEAPGLHRVLFRIAALVLFLVLAVEGWRWTQGRAPGDEATSDRVARWGRPLLAAAAIALLGGVGLLALTLRDLASTADYGAPLALKAALVALLAGSLLTAPAALAAGAAWVRGSGTLAARLRMGAGVLAALLLVALLSYWNLLGLNY